MRVLIFYDSLTRNAHAAYNTTGRLNSWVDGLEAAFEKYTGDDFEVGFVSSYGKPKANVTRGRFTYICASQDKNIAALLHTRNNEKAIQFYQDTYRKIVEDYKPDIIHIFGSEHPYIFLCSEYPEKTLVSIQGIRVIWEYYRIKYQNMVKKNEARLSKSWKYYVKKMLFGENFGWRDAYESKYVKSARYFATQNFFVKSYYSMLCPDATYFYNEEVLRREFYNAQWTRQKAEPNTVISIMSGQVAYKGFDGLLLAAKTLNDVGLSNVVFKVAGVEESSYLGKVMKRRMATMNIPRSQVKFLGYMTAEQLIDEMKKTFMFAHFCHIENTPNTLKEAQALGMPCLAPYTGGVSTLLKEGEEGLIFQDTNHFSAAAMIAWMMRNPDQAAEMGQAARSRRHQDSSPERIAKKFVEIYTQIHENSR